MFAVLSVVAIAAQNAAPQTARIRSVIVDPATLTKPLADRVADVRRRLHEPAVQHPEADQHDEREEPHARVDDAGADRPAGRCSADDHRRRGHARVHRRHDQGRRSAGRRNPVRHRPRQRVGARRARRPRNLALLLEDARRHPHRQSRRGHLVQLSVLRDARTTTSSRSMRKPDKERWHVEIADFDEQYFSTPAPVIVDNHVIVGTGNDLDGPGFLQAYRSRDREAAMEVLHGADEGRRSRTGDVAQPRGGEVWRRPHVDARLVRSGNEALHLRHRATRRPLTRASRGRETTCTHARSLRSMSTPARWRGTTRCRRTTRTTGIRCRTRCSSTRRVNGKPRKLVSVAARNGYFFTVDRVTGEHIVTTKYGTHTNWAGGLNSKTGALAGAGKRGDYSWRPRVAGRRRHDELAAARVLARYRARLHAGSQLVQHAVSHRSRSARIDGARRKAARGGRIGGKFLDRHRSCHG